MKRVALLCLGLAVGAASVAEAQLTMQMSNGWSFTFGGNVNSFLYYTKSNTTGATATPGGIVPAGATGAVSNLTRITVGLLPAFAVFDAKGKEGNTDLGVHFGFAPSVQCGIGVNDCFGTGMDMRQVYLTVGGSWGQLLVGRELGLFSRQNILTDQTLFGVGGSGAGTGPGNFGEAGGTTTLGRIGYGYVYPQFRAQMSFSTPTGRPAQLQVGLFEAAAVGAFGNTRLPRAEAEFSYSQSSIKAWVGGTVQSTKTAPTGATNSLTTWGGSGGVRYQGAMFSVTGSGYYGKGIGTTFFGANGTDGGAIGSDNARKSYGFIGQVTVTPASSKVTIAGSYGSSFLKASSAEAAVAATDFRTENTLISGGIYYQATKSLKAVGEFNYEWTKGRDATAGAKNTRVTPALGFMLFF
jgi:Gram-negative porin